MCFYVRIVIHRLSLSKKRRKRRRRKERRNITHSIKGVIPMMMTRGQMRMRTVRLRKRKNRGTYNYK
jgi:hypothetical protein